MTESLSGQPGFNLSGLDSPDQFDQEFGAKLRTVREARGLSQRFLVSELNDVYRVRWHQTTLAKTESGERPVRFAEAVALAGALGVSLDELNPATSGGVGDRQALVIRAHELENAARLLMTRRGQLLKVAEETETTSTDSLSDIFGHEKSIFERGQ